MEIDPHTVPFSCKWCQKTMGPKLKWIEIHKSTWGLVNSY